MRQDLRTTILVSRIELFIDINLDSRMILSQSVRSLIIFFINSKINKLEAYKLFWVFGGVFRLYPLPSSTLPPTPPLVHKEFPKLLLKLFLYPLQQLFPVQQHCRFIRLWRFPSFCNIRIFAHAWLAIFVNSSISSCISSFRRFISLNWEGIILGWFEG